MPKKVEECVKSVIKEHGYDEDRAWAICVESMKDEFEDAEYEGREVTLNKPFRTSGESVSEILDEAISVSFEDKAYFHDKNVVSIRDGVMKYLGSELGVEPKDRIYTVYRSPQEVRRIAGMIKGIPITVGHVSPTSPVPEDNKHGFVKDAKIVSAPDPSLKSTIAAEHEVQVTDNMLKFNQDRELSLGYTGRLIPHSEFDFEQVGITPHHLAVVPNGRCGVICSFKDAKVDNFLNEDGTLNIEAITAAMQSLQEAISNSEDMSGKNAVYELLKGMMPMEEESEEEEMEDEEVMEEKKEEFADADAIKAKAVSEFKDSKEFKDLMGTYAQERVETIVKARKFCDEGTCFKDMSNLEIMKKALKAAKPDVTFSDNEIPVAFKMLEKATTENYKSFGDQKTSDLKQIESRELY